MAKTRGGGERRSKRASRKTKRAAGAVRRKPATAAMAPAAPTARLVADTTTEGRPFIPGVSTPSPSPGPSGSDELIVEVEFAPGASSLATALVSNTAAFLGGAPAAGAPFSSLAAVLNQFNLLDAHPVFSHERAQADAARRASLREAAAVGAASEEQASAYERLPALNQYVRLRFAPGTSARAVSAALKRLADVTQAVAVPRAAPPESPPPVDPLIGGAGIAVQPGTAFESQWYLHRTRVPAAWRFGRGANVVIADIDWGFRTTHEELQGAITQTYNAVDGSNDVSQGPHAAHGTAVLGIAGARANAKGIAGYAPEAVLWAIQGDSSPSGQRLFAEPWAEAIDFVRRTHAGARRKVIILEVQTGSGGNYEQVPSVHRAIRAAIADGCVVCVAAGNGNRPADRNDAEEPFEPTGSILVGATAHHPTQNKRAFFSNFGSRVIASAPGDLQHDVTCGHSADNAYTNAFGGTSGATPKVAGTVALMLSVNPTLTHEDIREILSGTGVSLTEDPGRPIGVLVNAEAAVAEALRRRTDADPAMIPEMPQKPWRMPLRQRLHGVHRRKSQMVLPRESDNPLSWDEIEEPSDYATEAASVAAAPPGQQPPTTGDKPLRLFRTGIEGTLTREDRILLVEQAIQLLENFYVHRPMKEAMHAVRPVQRLRTVLRRLRRTSYPSMPSEAGHLSGTDELSFHNLLTEIFNSVRDLHTGYQLPRPYRDYIAFLPFEVATFYEGGRRRYLVTRVVAGYSFADSSFGPGAELLYWNGMSIERAVRANAAQTAGSNEAARHARGVSALTIRPMNTALPPDADFVELEFLPPGAASDESAQARSMRQLWFVRYTPPTAIAPAAAASNVAPPAAPASPADITFTAETSLDLARESVARSADLLFNEAQAPRPPSEAASGPASPAPAAMNEIMLAAVLGIDAAADAVREARRLIFEPAALRGVSEGSELGGVRASASPSSAMETTSDSEVTIRHPWAAAFRARRVLIDGVAYGHIRIHTFYLNDADGFVTEFVRLLGQIPETGLILDVRGNGGGNILAAERLLQTLTPAEIDPERLQFIVSPGTLDLCVSNPSSAAIPLDQWLPSIEEGVETGSVYSQPFPLTSKESCNAVGQQYYGPVVLIVDGNCYSATDMFAAGFQDHQIGFVLGVSEATGAGGANVWEHRLLCQVLPANWGLKPLPAQAGLRVAIRQCLRVGRKAGALLEDFGVIPDSVHTPTRADLMEGDRDLLARAAEVLKRKALRSIQVGLDGLVTDGRRQMTIQTRNLKRLDFFVDGRPHGSRDISVDGAGRGAISGASVRLGARLRIVGYEEPHQQVPAATYQTVVN